MAINENDLEKLLEGIDFKNLTAEQITGQDGLLKLLSKKIIEKAMGSEMDQHLGYAKHDASGRNNGNSRNGKSKKTLLTDHRVIWRSMSPGTGTASSSRRLSRNISGGSKASTTRSFPCTGGG